MPPLLVLRLEEVGQLKFGNKISAREQRKKKKRRKKKVPKSSSSLLARDRAVGRAGGVHEREFDGMEKTKYVQRADVLINTHTVVSGTVHAEPLNSVHSKEVAGYMGRDGQVHRGEGDEERNHPQERDACIEFVQ